MDDIIKIIKSLEELGVSIEIVKEKRKNKKKDFLELC